VHGLIKSTTVTSDKELIPVEMVLKKKKIKNKQNIAYLKDGNDLDLQDQSYDQIFIC